MKKAKHILIMSVAFCIFGAYLCISSAFIKPKEPCNPVKPPIVYRDATGKDITTKQQWNEGIVFRVVDGQVQTFSLIKYHKK